MQYFTIDELYYSDTANKYNIDNTPTSEVITNLTRLVDNILDKARAHFGKPIHVNSGYRCPELNEKIGGVKNSQHLKGEAADIELGSKTIEENKLLFDWIKSNCDFDQLIWEKGGAWVHVSCKEVGNRNRTLNL